PLPSTPCVRAVAFGVSHKLAAAIHVASLPTLYSFLHFFFEHGFFYYSIAIECAEGEIPVVGQAVSARHLIFEVPTVAINCGNLSRALTAAILHYAGVNSNDPNEKVGAQGVPARGY